MILWNGLISSTRTNCDSYIHRRQPLNCPVCNGDTRVLRTDETERRRECVRCGHRFPTVEVLKDDHERSLRIIEDARALAERIQKAA